MRYLPASIMLVLSAVAIGMSPSARRADEGFTCVPSVHAALPQQLNAWSSDTTSLRMEVRADMEYEKKVVLRTLIRKDSVLIAYTRALESKVYTIGSDVTVLRTSDMFPHGGIEILPALTRSLTKSGMIKPGEYTVQCQLLNADDFDEVVYEGCMMRCTVAGFSPPVLVEPPTYHWLSPVKEVSFTWRALTPLPAIPHTVRYRLLIYEVPEGTDPDDMDWRRRHTAQYWSDPQSPLMLRGKPRSFGLRPGGTYVWTVQAVDEKGMSYGTNNGYAESFVMRVRH